MSSQDSVWVIHADKPIIGVFCFFHAIASKYFVLLCICWLYYTHFEVTGGLCNLIGSNWCDLLSNHTIFALNRIFFPTSKQVTLKKKQPIRFQGLFKETNQIERQSVSCGKFCNFFIFPTPPPPKWINLISNRLSTVSIKYKNWPSPVFGQFQNGCNKVVIEPHVVQFWSKIILVISAKIALHSVQLPLLIPNAVFDLLKHTWY